MAKKQLLKRCDKMIENLGWLKGVVADEINLFIDLAEAVESDNIQEVEKLFNISIYEMEKYYRKVIIIYDSLAWDVPDYIRKTQEKQEKIKK